MNAARRKVLAQARAHIEAAQALVQQVGAEEREAYESMPEGLQDAEGGQKIDTAASTLEELDGELDDLLAKLDEAAE